MNEFFLLPKKSGVLEKDIKTLTKDEKSKSFSDFSKVLREYNKQETLNKSQYYFNKDQSPGTIHKTIQQTEISDKIFLTSWGFSRFGQLGSLPQSSKPISLNFLDSFMAPFDVSCGENHSAIITQKLKLFTFGNNVFGQLGIPEQPILYRPQLVPYLKDKQITMVSCGSDFTYALTTQNEVYSWGLNLKGQLGLGDYENRFTPTLVSSLQSTKDLSGNSISPSKELAIKRQKSSNDLLNKSIGFGERKNFENPILLQQDEFVVEISCGTLHTLVKTNFNRVLSTGFGDTYALGHGDQSTLAEFKMIINLLKNKPITKSNYEVEKIAAGFSHSACLCNGRVYMWGVAGSQEHKVFKTPTLIEYCVDSNKNRMEFKDIIDIKLGEMFSLFLNSKGEVYVYGDNNEFQLGMKEILYDFPQKIEGIKEIIGSISCGKKHSFAISIDRKTTYGWGSNLYHQLGPNNEAIWQMPTRIPHLRQSECIRLICGSYHTFAMTYSIPHKENLSPQENKGFDMSFVHEAKANLEREYQKLSLEYENMKREKDKLEQKIILQQSELDQFKMEQLRRKKSENYIKPSGKSPAFDPEKPLPTPRDFTPNYEIEYSELVLGQQISEGGYGKIYKGRWRETEVAIKMLKMEGASENHVRDFLSECKVMEVLRHPNIVLFLGACIKPPNLGIVLEFCSKGSLWSVLQNHNIDLSWEDRKKIALDTAKGVFYLHSFNPPILHRDLKSLNLLLDDALRIKLIDFGWTRKLDIKMTGKIGTYQWMAPEVISSQHYTEKADVFSFGIILWEIASREPPYRHISGLQVSIEVVNNDLRPTIPKKTPEVWAKLMKRCWDRDPQKRPSFKEIIKEIESFKL